MKHTENNKKTKKTANINRNKIPLEQIHPSEEINVIQDSEHPQADIPQFDIANQILTQQRKISANKRARKNHIKKTDTKSAAPPAKIGDLPKKTQNRNPVIVEIVARDIEKLCCGKTGISQK